MPTMIARGDNAFASVQSVADRVLDLLGIEAEVLRELSNRLPGVVSLGDDAGLNSCASNDWLAKPTPRVDHDAL